MSVRQIKDSYLRDILSRHLGILLYDKITELINAPGDISVDSDSMMDRLMNEMPQNKHEADEMIEFMVNIDDLAMLLVNIVDNFSPE